MDDFNENTNNENTNNNVENFDAFENNQGNVNEEKPKVEETIKEEPKKEEPKKKSDKTILIVVIILLVAVPIVIFSLIFFGGMFIQIFNQTDKVVREASMNSGNSNTIIGNDITNTDNTVVDYEKDAIDFKTWEIDPFKLSYNEENWSELKYQGYDMIKYKDMNNYVGFLGGVDFNAGDTFTTPEFREGFEEQSKESFSSSDVTYLYSDWSGIEGAQHVCKMFCSSMSTDSGEEGYITYYFYFLGGKMYTFMTTEEELDANFEAEAEEILEGVIL